MDPNANLEEIRRLVSRHMDGDGLDTRDIDRLAELVKALDEWIADGGALPAVWRR